MLVLVGCGKRVKTFTSDAGIEITLNSSFHEKEIVSQTLYLESDKMIFTALKEDKSLFEQVGINFASYSLNAYTNLVLENNKLSTEIKTEEGLIYFSYEKEVSGKKFTYQAYTFKGSDEFWLCQFAVETKNYVALLDNIVKYAKSIVVN